MNQINGMEGIDQFEKQFVELCNQQRDTMIGLARLISSVVKAPETRPEEGVTAVRQAIASISAKQFVSASEAAELFGCSPQHIRNLVQRAMDGKASEPIPFRDLDGVITFPLAELIDWSKKPKPKLRRPARKNKPHLRAIPS